MIKAAEKFTKYPAKIGTFNAAVVRKSSMLLANQGGVYNDGRWRISFLHVLIGCDGSKAFLVILVCQAVIPKHHTTFREKSWEMNQSWAKQTEKRGSCLVNHIPSAGNKKCPLEAKEHGRWSGGLAAAKYQRVYLAKSRTDLHRQLMSAQ